jgi:hypothetical protein
MLLLHYVKYVKFNLKMALSVLIALSLPRTLLIQA